MRQIKFRAWDGKQMLYGILPWNDNAVLMIFSAHDIVPAKEVMQFTGLKDKYGIEIYEGDVIARYWSDGTVLQRFEVKWFDDKSGYNINPDLLESTRHNQQTGMTAQGFTVIGNVYENPKIGKQA